MYQSRIAGCVGALALGSSAHAGTIIGLGDLPGGKIGSDASAMTPDARFVVGVSDTGLSWDGFLWSAQDGEIRPMPGERPDAGLLVYPTAVAAEGRAIVGAWERGFTEAFRWSTEAGYEGLGFLPSIDTKFSWASGVSSDGRAVVGVSTSRVFVTEPFPIQYETAEAFLWTPEKGMVGLGFAPDSRSPRSGAVAISSDGAVITGSANVGRDEDTTRSEAFRWTADTGIIPIGGLPGMLFSTPTAMSPDGSVIVGKSTNDDLFSESAFRWSADTGMQEVPGLAGADWVRPLGVSGDGSVIVGESVELTTSYDYTAFIWTAKFGTRPLLDVLREAGVEGIDGWQLISARSVSADGLTIAGTGINPAGEFEAWIATIPTPGSAAVAVIGTIALGWRGRRLRSWNGTA